MLVSRNIQKNYPVVTVLVSPKLAAHDVPWHLQLQRLHNSQRHPQLTLAAAFQPPGMRRRAMDLQNQKK